MKKCAYCESKWDDRIVKCENCGSSEFIKYDIHEYENPESGESMPDINPLEDFNTNETENESHKKSPGFVFIIFSIAILLFFFSYNTHSIDDAASQETTSNVNKTQTSAKTHKKSQPTSILLSTPTPSPTISPTSVPTLSPIPEKTYYSVGETAELDGLKVTLNSITEFPGRKYSMPDDNNIFVLCEFEIENNTGNDVAFSPSSFGAYYDGYYTYYSMSGMTSVDSSPFGGTLAPNKKSKGIQAYELPSDWQEFEIIFDPGYSWFTQELTFLITK